MNSLKSKNKISSSTLQPMRRTAKLWDRDAVMTYIFEQLTSTSMGLNSILLQAPYEMPCRRLVHGWIAENVSYQHSYARAREAQSDYMLEEINSLADNAGSPLLNDEGESITDKHGNVILIVDAVAVNKARLKIDTRKWTMGKVSPKKYGEKNQHEGDVNLHLTLEQAIAATRQERLEEKD